MITSDAFVRVVLATPDPFEEVAKYYQAVDPTLVKEDFGYTSSILSTESKLRRVEIRMEGYAPLPSETSKPYVYPPGSKTFISLTVSDPIHKYK